MKLSFWIIFKIFLILTIFIGCATTEEIKETDPIVLLDQGIAFGKDGQYDRAIAYFNKAIEINPRFAEAYTARGGTYLIKGQYDKVISDCNKAIEINPKLARAYAGRGGAYAGKGQYDKAIFDCNKAIEINPKLAEAYLVRGATYAYKGQHDKACSDWKRACELGLCIPYELAKRIGVCK